MLNVCTFYHSISCIAIELYIYHYCIIVIKPIFKNGMHDILWSFSLQTYQITYYMLHGDTMGYLYRGKGQFTGRPSDNKAQIFKTRTIPSSLKDKVETELEV